MVLSDGPLHLFLGRMIPCENVFYVMGMDAEYGNYLSVPLMTRAVPGSGPYAFLWVGIAKKPARTRPTPLIFHHGRAWTAVERGSWDLGFHHAGVLSGSLSRDPLDPSAWTLTPFTAPDPSKPGAANGGAPALLEDNVFYHAQRHDRESAALPHQRRSA